MSHRFYNIECYCSSSIKIHLKFPCQLSVHQFTLSSQSLLGKGKQNIETIVWYSLSLTDPSIPNNTLSLLMSLWMTWLACRNSSACKHWMGGKKKKYQHRETLFVYANTNSKAMLTPSASVECKNLAGIISNNQQRKLLC